MRTAHFLAHHKWYGEAAGAYPGLSDAEDDSGAYVSDLDPSEAWSLQGTVSLSDREDDPAADWSVAGSVSSDRLDPARVDVDEFACSNVSPSLVGQGRRCLRGVLLCLREVVGSIGRVWGHRVS